MSTKYILFLVIEHHGPGPGLDYPREENIYLTKTFHVWSCDIEKVLIPPFLSEKNIIFETARARAKSQYKCSAFGCHYMVKALCPWILVLNYSQKFKFDV